MVLLIYIFIFSCLSTNNNLSEKFKITGELKQWHNVTISFKGPDCHEEAETYTNYRLNITFHHPKSGAKMIVPGYFAADGNAAGTGATAGNIWRVHLSPPKTGLWKFKVSCRQGENIAVSSEPGAGKSVKTLDNISGSFTVLDSDKNGIDLRSKDKGLIKNNNDFYLTYQGSGKPCIIGGPGIPENFFGYKGFDAGGNKDYTDHIKDWQMGDPVWGQGKGKGIIGAVNFIANTGCNGLYVILNNIGGDGKDVYPHPSKTAKTVYDCSKLDQWEIVFSHLEKKGIVTIIMLQETEPENEKYYDKGKLGPERKIYFRELIARLGHHNGLIFDNGEENDMTNKQQIERIDWIKSIDPYDHPCTSHTRTAKKGKDSISRRYKYLLGYKGIDLTSWQINEDFFNEGSVIEEWRKKSAEKDVKWAIGLSEPHDYEYDNLEKARKIYTWPVFMSGGSALWAYVKKRGNHKYDYHCQNLHEFEIALRQIGYTVSFLKNLPLLEMEPVHDLVSSSAEGKTYCLAKKGEIYVVYQKNTGNIKLDLRDTDPKKTFTVKWFNPRIGKYHGDPISITGGEWIDIESKPGEQTHDWVILVK